ncbi:MAG: cysteine--tRNA ligase [Archaeoglobales archaeon]|nr:cysteine--tRNA ligase [Archaeoglobales archaeon]
MKLYNTLTRTYEEVRGNEIKIYVCGVTTYDYSHIGHARSAVVFDTLRRYLEYKGFRVKFVQNFTDIDDKIVKRALDEKKSWREISEKFTNEYLEDVKKLNVKPADAYPKVSEHIKEIIDFIQDLIEKNYAYVLDGDVYFHVPIFKRYGELSKMSLEELNKHRIEPDERKRDIKDFALWKKAKKEDYEVGAVFKSPWGDGRPGWHIECSTLSSHYLGVPFEIHGGGKDLIFPHHENERAQSYARFGFEPVKIWVHNDFVTVNGEKMSKSLGNIVRIRDVVEKFGGEALRYFLLSAHYRSAIDYSEKAMESAKKSYEKLKNTLLTVDMEIAYLKTFGDRECQEKELNLEEFVKDFENAMDDDLNTRKAIAVLHNFANYINKIVFDLNVALLERTLDCFLKLSSVLGFFEGYKRIPKLREDDAKKVIEREDARRRKDFELADKIRKEFAEKGIKLLDTSKGTRWLV